MENFKLKKTMEIKLWITQKKDNIRSFFSTQKLTVFYLLLPIIIYLIILLGDFRYTPNFSDFPKNICNKIKQGEDSLIWDSDLHVCGQNNEIKNITDSLNFLNNTLIILKKQNSELLSKLNSNHKEKNSIDTLIILVNDIKVKMNNISHNQKEKGNK